TVLLAVGDRVLDIAVVEGAQPLARAGAGEDGGGDAGAQVGEDASADGGEQGGLVGEVTVGGHPGQAGEVADRTQRHGVEPFLAQQVQGALDQPVPGVVHHGSHSLTTSCVDNVSRCADTVNKSAKLTLSAAGVS